MLAPTSISIAPTRIEVAPQASSSHQQASGLHRRASGSHRQRSCSHRRALVPRTDQASGIAPTKTSHRPASGLHDSFRRVYTPPRRRLWPGWESLLASSWRLWLPGQPCAWVRRKPAALRAPRAATAKPFSPPKTPWGDPDLQGGWTNVNENGIPFERPDALAGKQLEAVDDSELAELVRERDEARVRGAAAIGGRDTGAGPVHWYEHYGAKNSRAWMVIDPPDGRIPPQTPAAVARIGGRAGGRGGRAGGAGEGGRADSWLDRSFYDRCITRGVPGIDDAGDLRQCLRHHTGARHRRGPLRDDPRDPDHPPRLDDRGQACRRIWARRADISRAIRSSSRRSVSIRARRTGTGHRR